MALTLAMANNRLGAAPARKILLGLTAVVLVGHWLALGGRIDLWPDSWFQTPTELGPLPTTTPSKADMPALAPTLPDLPKPVAVATVRWIAPPPPPAPEPETPAEPAPPPPKPVKIVKKKETPPPPAPDIIETPVPEPVPVAVLPPPALPEPVELPPDEPIPMVTESAPVQAAESTTTAAAESIPLPPVTLAPNATLNYDVKGQAKGLNYHADGTLQWQQKDGAYEARLEVSAFFFGSYVQLSTGTITPQGLAPERFSIKRRSKEKAAHFERSTGRIRYSSNAPDAPLLPGAQDQLSVTLQLASLLNTYANLGGARTVSLPVSSDGASEPWQFEVGKVVVLKLPAGEIHGLLLTRAPRRDFDKKVQLWLAPTLGHLPVRMRITEHNGDFLDLQLKDLPPIEAPSSPESERSLP